MICWVDVETTGLDPREGSLLEVGVILTDDDLNEQDRTDIVLQPPPNYRETMRPEVIAMHEAGEGNGLLADCEAFGLSTAQGEYHLSRWLSKRADTPVMAGSTVGFDRAWLKEHMPLFEALFHYRSIDVSSLKELNARWGFAPAWSNDRRLHRALPDLEDSIAELRRYRKAILV